MHGLARLPPHGRLVLLLRVTRLGGCAAAGLGGNLRQRTFQVPHTVQLHPSNQVSKHRLMPSSVTIYNDLLVLLVSSDDYIGPSYYDHARGIACIPSSWATD